ncbi:uncharacterized protein TNCT_637981, partial [Trichonephila clavata]
FAKLDFSSDSSEKNFSDAVRNIQLAHNMSLNAESMFGWNVQSDKGSTLGETMDVFLVYLPEKESAFLENPATALFSVHSPFGFDNLVLHKNEMNPGHLYKIYIRVEEEHLLPYPYFTNCTDYNTLWNANNRKGPRSQQVNSFLKIILNIF